MSAVQTPVGSAEEPVVTSPLRRALGLFANQQFILLLVLVAVMVYFDVHNSRFFSVAEFQNLIVDLSAAALVAVAELFVIVSGGIDLSVGSTIAVSGVIGAQAIVHLQSHHFGELPSLLVGMIVCTGVGGAVGAVNAVLITKANLVPFVATLVTLSAGAGLALFFSQGAQIGYDPVAATWSSTGFWIFTWQALIVLVIVGVLGLVLHFTSYGRYNYAIGSNPFAARAAGINVNRHVASVYVMSGMLAGLTGMFFYIRIGGGAPQTGIGTELEAIAAVVIGGASLVGGVGLISGTILGVAILTVVTDGLVFINVSTYWNQVVVAGFIAVAAILQTVSPGTRKR